MNNSQHTKVRFVKCPTCAEFLQEPEHVPLYSCGGCSTILQAKYYRGNNKVTEIGSRQQNVVQSDDAAHAPDGGESSGSKERSSSDEQTTDQTGRRDQKTVENSRSEQTEAPNTADHTLLSESSSFHDNHGNGVIDNKINQFDWRDSVANQNLEQFGAAKSAIEASLAGGVTALENKDSEQFTPRNPEEDVNRQDEEYNNSSVENHNQKRIEGASCARGTSELHESQVLANKVPSDFASDHAVLGNSELQHPVVNGAIKTENDQHEQSCDIVFDSQKQDSEVSSAIESSSLNEFEDKKLLQLASEIGKVPEESDGNMLEESRKGHLEVIRSDENEAICHDIKRTGAVTTLAKEDNDAKDRDDPVDCIEEQLDSLNLREGSSSTDITRTNEVGSTGEIEANSGACRSASASACAPSGVTNLGTTKEMGSSYFSQPLCERNSVDKPRKTSVQKVGNLDDSVVYGSEQVKFTNKPEMPEPLNTHKEVDSSLIAVPRSEMVSSLTKGSLACDGRVYSLDGNDDQLLEQQEHILKETLTGNGAVAGCEDTQESPEWSTEPSRRIHSSSEFQNQAKRSSQVLLDKKLKISMADVGELQKANVAPERNRIRLNRDRFPPRVPFHWSSEVTYETGSSSYVHDELSSHQLHRLPCSYDDSDPWLRKVYSQKGNMDRRRFPQAAWRESEFLPEYYNYETSGEIYPRSQNHGYIDRRRRAESWSQSGNLPPISYSGEPFNGRYQIRNPYMHRHPDKLRWSSQLPPRMPAAYFHQGLYASPSREMIYDLYESYPKSPPRFMESEFYPCAPDTMSLSDDQRHTDLLTRRLYLREKQKAAKRFLQPQAGGAPFISCYFCFKVLQLPKNYLLPKRRTMHQLKCGHCLRILEFSFQNESCFTLFTQNVNADEEANVGRKMYSASSGGANHFSESSLVARKAQVQYANTKELRPISPLDNLGLRNSRSRERKGGSHNASGSSVQAR